MKSILTKSRTFYVLLGLNFFTAVIIFYISRKFEFPDANSYWYMADGLKHNTFSSWYFLPVHTPETLRTWGYPVFIYLCSMVYDSPETVKLVQLLMYFGSIFICLKLIAHFNKDLLYRNLFLLILLPNIQIVYYTGQVASEATSVFGLVLFFYLWYTKKDSWSKYIILGVLSFILFQIRPAFILAPFCFLAYKILFNRTQLKYFTGFLFLFILSLIPFGLWNKKEHGVFKVTPLEGGAGAANLGYWSFRLPQGYNPQFYWDASFSDDLTQPNFFTEEEKKVFQLQYEEEWKEINNELKQYITKEDSARMAIYAGKKYRLWEVMSSGYTIAREKLLAKHLVKDIKQTPGYYIKSRLYTLARLWFTGVNKQEFNKASFAGKLKLLYPFLVTFIFIFCGIIIIIFSLLKKWLSFKQYWPLLLIIAYYGVMHLPFGIQARYTVPVHLFIILLLAMITGAQLQKKDSGKQA